jgi:hypothetical protein
VLLAVVTVAGLAVGFVIGLCSYRASRRWCGSCGRTLRCPACHAGAAQPNSRTYRV